jgi:AraC family transcriptional regulator of adaptative response/methylated-DNA-[protein]-cysteine methyltransferase
MNPPDDLWLAPHDSRVRALRDWGRLEYAGIDTRFGPCAGVSYGGRLIALRFGEHEKVLRELRGEWPSSALEESVGTATLLRKAFETPTEVPIMAIGTPFRLSVWEILRRSAHASTMTYGEVGYALGRSTAARAVGQAVGANPLAVVIPCHRVVSRGKLTGYRWGLDLKKSLLAWELSRKDPLEMPF